MKKAIKIYSIIVIVIAVLVAALFLERASVKPKVIIEKSFDSEGEACASLWNIWNREMTDKIDQWYGDQRFVKCIDRHGKYSASYREGISGVIYYSQEKCKIGKKVYQPSGINWEYIENF